MAANNLNNKFMQVLNEVPNFVTDETAQAGNRTYKYLNLATILKPSNRFREVRSGIQPARHVRQHGRNATGHRNSGNHHFDDTDQMVVCSYPFFVTGDPQQVGSAITYARRYSLYAVLGIFPDKDDDGAYAKQRYETADRAISAEQYADLVKSMDAHNITSAERGDFINGTLKRRVRGWNELTQTDLNSLMNAVNRM